MFILGSDTWVLTYCTSTSVRSVHHKKYLGSNEEEHDRTENPAPRAMRVPSGSHVRHRQDEWYDESALPPARQHWPDTCASGRWQKVQHEKTNNDCLNFEQLNNTNNNLFKIQRVYWGIHWYYFHGGGIQKKEKKKKWHSFLQDCVISSIHFLVLRTSVWA